MVMMAASPAQVAAQEDIDPATISAPDVALPKDAAAVSALVNNGWKYFFFHKAGVTFETARADIAFCNRYVPAEGLLRLPAFVSWNAHPKRSAPDYRPMGVVGGIALDVINETFDRRAKKSRQRRCMETRGYTRYPMVEDTWNKLDREDSGHGMLVLAKLASGPKPDLPVVTK